jgi:hypothetical protein
MYNRRIVYSFSVGLREQCIDLQFFVSVDDSLIIHGNSCSNVVVV